MRSVASAATVFGNQLEVMASHARTPCAIAVRRAFSLRISRQYHERSGVYVSSMALVSPISLAVRV